MCKLSWICVLDIQRVTMILATYIKTVSSHKSLFQCAKDKSVAQYKLKDVPLYVLGSHVSLTWRRAQSLFVDPAVLKDSGVMDGARIPHKPITYCLQLYKWENLSVEVVLAIRFWWDLDCRLEMLWTPHRMCANQQTLNNIRTSCDQPCVYFDGRILIKASMDCRPSL